jgi:gliding motility-associated-like protein
MVLILWILTHLLTVNKLDMKAIITLLLTVFGLASLAQGPIASNACNQAQNICNSLPVPFQLTTGASPNPVVPVSGSFSNPNTNPSGVNSGCLFSGELNPNWFVLNITSTGPLEFAIGAAGGTGFFDWELWPYDLVTGCSDIQNNLVAPAACNWNASSAGFTGMSAGGPPAGGVAGNFQPSIPVVAGTAYILMFSNYSSATGVVNLTFPPSGATVGCSGGTPDQTICSGDTATVDLTLSSGWVNASANWLVTNNVSDPTGITGVIVNPTVTTDYQVEIWDQGVVADTIEFTITVVDEPTPYAGVDQALCLGIPVNLNGISSDPVNTQLWTFSTAGILPVPTVNVVPNWSDPNAIVTVDQLGLYEFYFREGNATCGNYYDTMIVTVEDLSIAASFIAPSCEALFDGEIHVTSLDANEYSFDGGVTWQVDSFAVGFNAGTYNICAKSPLGCQKCIDIDVIDPPPVVISVSNDTLICQNGTAYLSASAIGGTSYLFHWGQTINTAANQTENPLVATTYTVYAENQNGCVSLSDSIFVSVRDSLTGTITDWDTVCPTYSTDILATVNGGLGSPYDFVWSSGDTYNGIANHTISVDPIVTTDYTVTITDGCESTPLILTTNIRVSPLPIPQYSILNPDQCEPAVFTIMNTTDPTMSQYNYWLVNGNQQFINQDTIVTDILMAGLYDIQMIIASFEGCVDSLTFSDVLNVRPKPVADFKHSPNPVTMFNTTVSFQNNSFFGHTYQWYFEDGIPLQSNQEDVQVSFPDGIAGSYGVTLITTSQLGCVDTMEYDLIVFPEVIIYAPNTFTPDGDEFNQSWLIHMEGVDPYDFELLIFNRWGEVIWESHDITIPWDGMHKGKPVEQGMYNWVVRAKDILNDGRYIYNGHVTIIR